MSVKGQNNHSLTLLAASALALSLGAAAVAYAARMDETRSAPKATKKDDDDEAENHVVVQLLPIERIMADTGGGDSYMSTVTWFRGDYRQVVDKLKRRAYRILQANPWLTGRLRKNQGETSLIFKKEINDDDTATEPYFNVLTETKLISRNFPLEQLGTQLNGLIPRYGPKSPVFKIVVLPCYKDPTEYFAILITMSHIVGDGETFYCIQNMMLDVHQNVESLIVDRITSTEVQQSQAMGGKGEDKILQTYGFLANCILGVLMSFITGIKSECRIYRIDTEAIKATKKTAVAKGQDGAVPFVSTNDVLTSSLLQNSNCIHGLMAINFRGRLEGHTVQHAGNYENTIFYRRKDSASPILIRKSLEQPTTEKNGPLFQRVVSKDEPLPSFWTWATGSIALVTNWATFAKPCSIPGCTEELSIPVYNAEQLLPSTLGIYFIFRAGPQGLAVLAAGTPDKLAALEKEVPFLSKKKLV